MARARLHLVLAVASLALAGHGAAYAQDTAQDNCGNVQGVCTAEPFMPDPDPSVVVDPDVTDPTIVHAEADRVCVLPNSCKGD